MKLFELTAPSTLYHVTFEDRVKSIMSNGLGGKGLEKRWSFSTGYTHLADTPETAKIYANDVGQNIGWDGMFAVLAVTGIDPSQLESDPNTSTPGCYMYKGVIPPSQIKIVDKFHISPWMNK